MRLGSAPQLPPVERLPSLRPSVAWRGPEPCSLVPDGTSLWVRASGRHISRCARASIEHGVRSRTEETDSYDECDA